MILKLRSGRKAGTLKGSYGCVGEMVRIIFHVEGTRSTETQRQRGKREHPTGWRLKDISYSWATTRYGVGARELRKATKARSGRLFTLLSGKPDQDLSCEE